MLVLGWDISTAVIGFCAMDSTDMSLVEVDRCILKGDTMYEKYDRAWSYVDEKLSHHHGVHYVEAPLANFTRGKTNKDTLMKLASINSVVSWAINGGGDRIVHIAPVTAKRICGLHVPKGGDKKAAAIEFVRQREPSFRIEHTKKGNVVRGTDDMADSYLLALSGCMIERGEAVLAEGKKARRDKAGPGRSKGRQRGRTRVHVPEAGLPVQEDG